MTVPSLRQLAAVAAVIAVWYVWTINCSGASPTAGQDAAKQSCADFDALVANVGAASQNASLVADGIRQAQIADSENPSKWLGLYYDWLAAEQPDPTNGIARLAVDCRGVE